MKHFSCGNLKNFTFCKFWSELFSAFWKFTPNSGHEIWKKMFAFENDFLKKAKTHLGNAHKTRKSWVFWWFWSQIPFVKPSCQQKWFLKCQCWEAKKCSICCSKHVFLLFLFKMSNFLSFAKGISSFTCFKVLILGYFHDFEEILFLFCVSRYPSQETNFQKFTSAQ